VGAVILLAPATASSAAPSAGSIEQQIQTQSKQLEKVVEQYDLLGDQLKATQTRAAALQRQLVPLKAQIAQASARVDSIAAEAYKGELLSEFSAVVSAPDAGAVMERLVTIAQIGKYEDGQISDLQDLQSSFNDQLGTLNATITDQQSKRQQMTEQRKSIEAKLASLYALRAQVEPSPPVDSGAGTPPPNVSGKAGLAVNFAYAQLGKPYVFAAAGPSSYDCSGLTMAAWKAAGVSLTHNAAEQWNEVAHIARSQLQPGDLVFYDGLGHVAIYVGSNQVIHAPEPGDVVRIASVDMEPPYGYGRP
jgi:cell wall-associated NlpC family hydrolase